MNNSPQSDKFLAPPRNLLLTPQQIDLIQSLSADMARQLLAMEFNVPEEDALMLRQHANMKGKFDMLTRLLAYDELVNNEYSEKLQAINEAGGKIHGDGSVTGLPEDFTF